MNTLVIVAVAMGLLLIVRAWLKTQIRKIEAEQEAKKEAIKWWLKGGKPNKTLLDIGYEFMPLISSNGARSLMWPEFNTMGGGSRELFDRCLLFGYNALPPQQRLDFVCVVGHLTNVKNWYELSLEERGKILKECLPEEYFQKNFVQQPEPKNT